MNKSMKQTNKSSINHPNFGDVIVVFMFLGIVVFIGIEVLIEGFFFFSPETSFRRDIDLGDYESTTGVTHDNVQNGV